MNSRDRLQCVLDHRQPDKLCVDFGSTSVTGIHVSMIEKIRDFYGLDHHPIKVVDPFQMLGEIEPDLQSIMCVDVVGISGMNTIFGFPADDWKPFKTPWGQECLVPSGFNTDLKAENGDLLMFPEGDVSVPASARMPVGGYFYDAIIRQIPIDDNKLNAEDNLEEFKYISDTELKYITNRCAQATESGKGIIGSFSGTAIGDVAFVPGMQLKNPKGIRDVAEWYMSTVMRRDYLHKVFSKQTDIAIDNLNRIYDCVGNNIDVINICGTDFGTQDSQFCSPEDFDSLYAPYYKKMNDWIHQHTSWKTFKHSCGAIVPLLSKIIDAGFDCINPVQISARDMKPERLKKEFGDKIVFWGGGVDTQNIFMYGKPAEVRDQVLRLCEIFGEDGGYVFNTVHNIQANVPIENVIELIETIRQIKR